MRERTLSPIVYFVIFAILLALTGTTVAVALLPGALAYRSGLAIALCKATLVALFFMHLLHSTRLTWVVILGALFWLAILLVLTLTDYLTRNQLAY